MRNERESDPIRAGFLRRQYEEGMALAASSDLLQLQPIEGDPPCRYIARFHAKGFVQTPQGIVAHDTWDIGIWFPADYLRRAVSYEMLRFLNPPTVWHPNVLFPLICADFGGPATPLVSVLYVSFELLTWHLFATASALNPDAAQWARNQPAGRFPTDHRPLKRRNLKVRVEPTKEDKR
jgi:hypothetical protein